MHRTISRAWGQDDVTYTQGSSSFPLRGTYRERHEKLMEEGHVFDALIKTLELAQTDLAHPDVPSGFVPQPADRLTIGTDRYRVRDARPLSGGYQLSLIDD